MTVVAFAALDPSEIKLQYKEPFVTAGINLKANGVISPGLYRGFVAQPTGVPSASLDLALDSTSEDSVLVVSDSANGYTTTVRKTAVLNLDFSGTFPITANDSGTESTIFGTPSAGIQHLTITSGSFVSQMIGKQITISGAVNGGNNGTFVITGFTNSNEIDILNASGVSETTSVTWSTVYRVWVVAVVEYELGSQTSGSIQAVDAGGLLALNAYSKICQIDLANGATTIQTSNITQATDAGEYGPSKVLATLRPWATSTEHGLAHPGYKTLGTPTMSSVSVTNATAVQLAGRYYIGTGATGTANQYFEVGQADSFTNAFLPLLGTDGRVIRVSQIQTSGGVQLNPAVDADEHGFYTNPKVALSFSETADLDTGTIRTVLVSAFVASTVGSIAQGAFALKPAGMKRPATDTAVYGTAWTRIPTGTTTVQNALDAIDIRLTSFGQKIVTVGTTGSNADFVGTTHAPFVSAIAALPSGGTIIVLPGTYTFAATVSLASQNLRIVGLNRKRSEYSASFEDMATIRVTETFRGPAFLALNLGGYAIENLTFNDTATSAVSGQYYLKFQIDGSATVDLDSFIVRGCVFNAPLAIGLGAIQFTNPTGTYKHNGILIESCTFKAGASGVPSITHACGANGGGSIFIRDNWFQGGDAIVSIAGASNKIIDNEFEGVAAIDLDVGLSGATVDNRIENNRCSSSSPLAVTLNWAGTDTSIQSNYFNSSDVTTSTTLFSLAGSRTIIKDNFFIKGSGVVGSKVIDCSLNTFAGSSTGDLVLSTNANGHVTVFSNSFESVAKLQIDNGSSSAKAEVLGNRWFGSSNSLKLTALGYAHIRDNVLENGAGTLDLDTTVESLVEGNTFKSLNSTAVHKLYGLCTARGNRFVRTASAPITSNGVEVSANFKLFEGNTIDHSNANVSGTWLFRTTAAVTSDARIALNVFKGSGPANYTRAIDVTSGSIPDCLIEGNEILGVNTAISSGFTGTSVIRILGNKASDLYKFLDTSSVTFQICNNHVNFATYDIAGGGFYFASLSFAGVINGNYITQTGNASSADASDRSVIRLTANTGHIVSNNRIGRLRSASVGIFVDGASACVISDNTVDAELGQGNSHATFRYGIRGGLYAVIRGNILRSLVGPFTVIDANTDSVVVGNTVNVASGATSIGIAALGNRVSITGNTILIVATSGTGSTGINTGTGVGTIASGNSLHVTSTNPVGVFAEGEHAAISGNTISASTGIGVSLFVGAEYSSVIGNNIYDTATGVNINAAVDKSIISGNHLFVATTPFNDAGADTKGLGATDPDTLQLNYYL